MLIIKSHPADIFSLFLMNGKEHCPTEKQMHGVGIHESIRRMLSDSSFKFPYNNQSIGFFRTKRGYRRLLA